MNLSIAFHITLRGKAMQNSDDTATSDNVPSIPISINSDVSTLNKVHDVTRTFATISLYIESLYSFKDTDRSKLHDLISR